MRKFFLHALGLLLGGFMFIDGLHVWLKGKYIGPEKPGPWAMLFEAAGINVFSLGPMFIGFGLCWMSWVVYSIKNGEKVKFWGISLAIATLWYLPFGTFLATIIVLGLLKFD